MMRRIRCEFIVSSAVVLLMEMTFFAANVGQRSLMYQKMHRNVSTPARHIVITAEKQYQETQFIVRTVVLLLREICILQQLMKIIWNPQFQTAISNT